MPKVEKFYAQHVARRISPVLMSRQLLRNWFKRKWAIFTTSTIHIFHPVSAARAANGFLIQKGGKSSRKRFENDGIAWTSANSRHLHALPHVLATPANVSGAKLEKSAQVDLPRKPTAKSEEAEARIRLIWPLSTQLWKTIILIKKVDLYLVFDFILLRKK